MGMIWVGYRRPLPDARRVLEDAELLDELLDSDDDTTSVDIDKAWHGVHWLLTGSADPVGTPVSNAVLGGEPLGEDLGGGPAHLLDPIHVRATADALRTIGTDDLRRRLSPTAMNEADIYPGGAWDEPDIFEEYLAPAFEHLREFYEAAARADEAVIQTIC